MNKRLYILLVSASAVSLWLLLQFHGKPQGSNKFAIPEPAAKQGNEPAIKNILTVKQINSNAPLQTIPTKEPQSKPIEVVRQALETKNSPIEFYGMVIDQNSNVLSGVKISVSIRHWELSTNADSRVIRLENETDSQGHFEINGAIGDAFDITSFKKVGYEVEPTRLGFGSSAGSFENPIVFKMWNKDVKEPLVTGSKFFRVIPNGQSYMIDLVQGTIYNAPDSVGDL